METVSTEISLRPLRVGFLVDPEERTTLSKVFRIASCMWGGMMCPLIPVMKNIPQAWQDEPFRKPTPAKMTKGYLRYFEPDVFVETGSGQFKAAGLKPIESSIPSRRRYRKLSSLLRTEPGLAPYLDLGISMDAVYEYFFHNEFQFKKRTDPQIFQFSRGDPIGEAFFETAYGMFPKGKVLGHILESYCSSLDAKALKPDIEAWKQIQQGQTGFPFHYTIRAIGTRFDDPHGPSIFVFDPCSAADVIDFWNFRLFTRDVMPVNVHWLSQSRELILEFIRLNHRPLPRNRNGLMISTTVHLSRSIDREAAMAVLDFAAADLASGSASIQTWYQPVWIDTEDDWIHRPGAVSLSLKRREAQVVPDGDRDHFVRIPSLSPNFQISPHGKGPCWVNVVRTRFYGANNRFAEAMPSAELDHKNSLFSGRFRRQFRSREGYVTLHDYPHEDSNLSLPTMSQVISGWLAAQGISAKASDAGRVADQVIASVGGLAGMNLLADREIIFFLDNMARSRNVRKDGDSEEFPDRTATIRQITQLLSDLSKKPSGVYKTLERFVDAGVVRLGIAVRCTHCTKENWYSLDEVASTIRCERCLKDFPFPQGEFPQRDNWKYRVVGPFATPHYAQGSYSVALTLRFLRHEIGSMHEFTFSTGLELDRGSQRIETDFFAWHNREGFMCSARDPSTLVGECKSFGSEVFKDRDLDRLRRLGTLLPGAFLVAATLKETLSDKEVTGLRTLCEWGWNCGSNDDPPSRLIVLTGIELFAHEALGDAWEESSGRLAEAIKHYPDIPDIGTLSEATQMAHLGFTRDQIEKMKYGNRNGDPPEHAGRMLIRV